MCPQCRLPYGDPWYHGPAGHAPTRLCLDCWSARWDEICRKMHHGGDWTQLDDALALICQGFSYAEAADVVRTTRQTLHNWIRRLRRRPELVPDWLLQLRDDARRSPSMQAGERRRA